MDEKDVLIAELWDRLESLEDYVIRMSVYAPGKEDRVPAWENRALAGYREAFPYKRGDEEHYKRNS